MNQGHGLPMSDVEKALQAADKEMGEKMGTTYQVDESLGLSQVHWFKTNSDPDEAKLKENLGKLKGFKSVWIGKGGFGVTFSGKEQANLAGVKKASGLDVTDVILAASKDGVRYYCPTHPDKVSPIPGECPVGKEELQKVEASEWISQASGEEPPGKASGESEGYTCPMCGGSFKNPGDCPKCGMKLVKKGAKKRAGRAAD